jgi:glucans biosynthesis protein C
VEILAKSIRNPEQDTMTISPSNRDHALDALRGAMMLLGVVIHTIIAYTSTPVSFWPVNDAARTSAADIGIVLIHQFRMQTFFLLAGFFAGLLEQRYGISGMIFHRLRRIGLPFLVSVVTVVPIILLIWIDGTPAAFQVVFKEELIEGNWSERFDHYIMSGKFLKRIEPIHLWFLYHLLACLLLTVVIREVIRLFPNGIERASRLANDLLTHRLRWLFLTSSLLPFLWFCVVFFIDTPDGWLIHWQILCYYTIFFGLGWFLYFQPELFQQFTRGWRIKLFLGGVVFFLLMLAGFDWALQLADGDPYAINQFTAPKILSIITGSISTWCLVFGMIGLFQRYLAQPRRWVRYLADASYWIYIVHLIPIILIQMQLQHYDLPVGVKIFLCTFLSSAILLASYALFVRHTFIGTFLNGKRK